MRSLVIIIVSLAGCSAEIGDDASHGGMGRIHASWTLRTGGAGVTCEDAGAAKVEITTYTPGGYFDRFPCVAGEGTTGSLVAGELAVYVTLLDAENNVLAQAAYDERVVVVGGEITEIGPYFFDL